MLADKLENPTQIKNEILKLGLEVQDKEVAHWGFKMIKLYHRQDLPLPPKKVRDYYGLPAERRKAMNAMPSKYASFWNDAEVRKHFDEVGRIEGRNQINKDFIKWMQVVFDKDTGRLTVIKEALGTFKHEKKRFEKVAKSRIDWDQ